MFRIEENIDDALASPALQSASTMKPPIRQPKPAARSRWLRALSSAAEEGVVLTAPSERRLIAAAASAAIAWAAVWRMGIAATIIRVYSANVLRTDYATRRGNRGK